LSNNHVCRQSNRHSATSIKSSSSKKATAVSIQTGIRKNQTYKASWSKRTHSVVRMHLTNVLPRLERYSEAISIQTAVRKLQARQEFFKQRKRVQPAVRKQACQAKGRCNKSSICGFECPNNLHTTWSRRLRQSASKLLPLSTKLARRAWSKGHLQLRSNFVGRMAQQRTCIYPEQTCCNQHSKPRHSQVLRSPRVSQSKGSYDQHANCLSQALRTVPMEKGSCNSHSTAAEYPARKAFLQQKDAVIKIQCFVRMHQQRTLLGSKGRSNQHSDC
jgi:hypothetical protein